MKKTSPPIKRARRDAWRRLTAIATLLAWVVTGLPLGAIEPNPDKKLTVDVLQGQGAEHSIIAPQEAAVTLRVTNEMEMPVTGAVVVFQLPQSGPGGAFLTGNRFATVMTDSMGLANAQVQPNRVPGAFTIIATVSYLDYQSETLNIEQANVNPAVTSRPAPGQTPARRGGSGKLIAIVALIGGAAAGAALGLAGGGGGGGGSPSPPPAPPPTTTISPGSPTFGPPR